jgi:hypothetical protein
LSQLQNQLNNCNEEFVNNERILADLQLQQKVELNTDEQAEIQKRTRETIEMFLDRRPNSSETHGKTMAVDVTFFPGKATLGSNLHIGGEGGGSRDAKFTVQLDQKVHTLAKQAAKYWSLDPDKVFFLDRDNRIVPDSMLLSDIILPPLPEDGPMAALEDGQIDPMANESALALRSDNPKRTEAYTVQGRNYSLTLVRSTTVLDKEDLTKPKGEEWADFTFDANQLNQELEATRKKKGLDEMGGKGPATLENIPSLYELYESGLQKKMLKRRDTRCRVAEFLVFLVCVLSFYLLIIKPDVHLTASMQLTSTNIDIMLANFTNKDKHDFHLGINSYREITTRGQYSSWLKGPFQRMVESDNFREENLHVLGVVGYIYKAEPKFYFDDLNVPWCSDPLDITTASNGSCPNGSNDSNGSNGTNVSNCSNDTGTSLVTPTETPTETPTVQNASANETPTEQNASANETPTEQNASAAEIPTGLPTSNLPRRLKGFSDDFGSPSSDDIDDDDARGKSKFSRRLLEPINIQGCVPRSFAACANEYTIEVFTAAIKAGDTIPGCEFRYHLEPSQAHAASVAGDGFSYVYGNLNNYIGGDRVFFTNFTFPNETGNLQFNTSMSTFLPDDPARIPPNNIAARVLAIFIYNPTLNGVILKQMLCEHIKSGGVTTKVITYAISLGFTDADYIYHVGYVLAIVTGTTCFIMELRRILGWPKSWSPEEKRDKCGCSTFFFLLLPLALSVSYVLHIIRYTVTANDLFLNKDFGDITSNLFTMNQVETWTTVSNMIVLLIFNILFVRYLLMYFPQLAFLQQMVRKVAKPLTVAFLLILAYLLTLSLVLFTFFSTHVYDFKELSFSFLTTLRFAFGGMKDWKQLYAIYPNSWNIIMTITFVIFTMVLNNLAISILLSFKKEKDLHENYSYHQFWATARGEFPNPNEFNPATVGWDFTGKEPRPPDKIHSVRHLA